MVGRIRNFRPSVSEPQVTGWINDRIRQAIDRRTFWSDLLAAGVISLPDAFDDGTVSLTTGSAIVTGVTTGWPVSDVVNATFTSDILDYGYAEATPDDMTGMEVGRYLYVDAAETPPIPETVPIIEVRRATIIAKFLQAHAATATVTASSLAGLQFRVGRGYPTFTVKSVHADDELELDLPWGGPALTGVSYQILKAYIVFGSDTKDILSVVDQASGRPLRIHVPQVEIAWRDPQRASSGPPQLIVDLSPDAAGNMLYEVWPWQTTARQLGYIYMRQWPELVDENDRPPHFINPSVFIHGALADALRFKRDGKDPFFDPALAREYEARFEQGLMDAYNADESKSQHAYDYNFRQISGIGGGANFWQSHDPDLMAGQF